MPPGSASTAARRDGSIPQLTEMLALREFGMIV